MAAPTNPFKAALRDGRRQIGFWCALAHPAAAEICAGAGFDWLLLDGEHAPNDIPLLLAQLQAIGHGGTHPVVRPPVGESWLLKQLLDLGAQTILVPMVESAAQARVLARAMRYPPDGVRGIGAALARASNYNRRADYLRTANDQVCLLVQVESRAGIAALDEIVLTEGVDGVFIGPADLAADYGKIGRPSEPEIVEQALARIAELGKPAGILTSDLELAKRYLDLGASFVAVGTDVGALVGATSQLAARFRS